MTTPTLSTCPKCGAQHLAGEGNCPYCSERAAPSAPPLQATDPNSARSISCAIIGVSLLLVAFNYLWLQPGNVNAGSTVNLHRLALGQTAGIAAAVFLAAGIRPR